MKLSLKLPDDHQRQQQLNPLVTAKIPISILNHPFLTTISTASLSSDLSFSFSSNFASGPSLKLSYSPTSSQTLSPPFSLSLKSGLGLFGSPNHSPLVFKAHFSLSSPNPTFSLHFKPQFGHFAFKKTTFSNPRGGAASGSAPKPGIEPKSGSGSGSTGGEAVNGSPDWQEVKLEPCGDGFGDNCEAPLGSKRAESRGAFAGVAVMARTAFPVGKRTALMVRWGLKFPEELGPKMPILTMNKIVFERVDSAAAEEKKRSGNGGDSELLKGMFYWMRGDLEALERENREIKRSLEEISQLGASKGKLSPPMLANSGPKGDGSGEFERWKSRKSGKEENVRREAKKPGGAGSDLESELQRAIAAAAAAGSSAS